jgi:phosphorylcholine metabolism protein LicD
MFIVFFISILVLTILLYIRNIYIEKCVRDNIEKSFLTPNEHEEFYKITKDAHEILTEVGIPYWAMGGTLLGVMRHKGQIPWDDDVDVAIHEKHEEKLKTLKKHFEQRGYNLISNIHSYQVSPKNGYLQYHNVLDYIYNFGTEPFLRGPYLDIFVMSEDDSSDKKNKKLLFKSTVNQIAFPNQELYEDELGSLPMRKFGSTEIRTPEYPKKYLERCFSKKWKEEAVISHFHRGWGVKFINPIKFSLEKNKDVLHQTDYMGNNRQLTRDNIHDNF